MSQNQETKKCPFCYNKIPKQAIKCSYCGEWLTEENKFSSCGIGFRNPVVITLSILVLICFCIIQYNTHNPNPLNTLLFVFIVFGVCGYVYLLPSIIAVSKKHPQALPIIAVNLLLGETLIGWIISIIWANSHRIGRNTHW